MKKFKTIIIVNEQGNKYNSPEILEYTKKEWDQDEVVMFPAGVKVFQQNRETGEIKRII